VLVDALGGGRAANQQRAAARKVPPTTLGQRVLDAGHPVTVDREAVLAQQCHYFETGRRRQLRAATEDQICLQEVVADPDVHPA